MSNKQFYTKNGSLDNKLLCSGIRIVFIFNLNE